MQANSASRRQLACELICVIRSAIASRVWSLKTARWTPCFASIVKYPIACDADAPSSEITLAREFSELLPHHARDILDQVLGVFTVCHQCQYIGVDPSLAAKKRSVKRSSFARSIP